MLGPGTAGTRRPRGIPGAASGSRGRRFDTGRVSEVRCERGVGGRILEVLDGGADVFERGRITRWLPGVGLAWENGFDVCFSTESRVPTYWRQGDYEKFGTYYWTGALPWAAGDENLMGPILDGTRAYVTMGEMCDALRDVWGVWRETPVF